MKPIQLDDVLQTLVTKIDNKTIFDNWEFYEGNSLEFSYFDAIVANINPSGNKNVRSVTYKHNGTNVFVQYFAWDSDDDIIKVSTLPLS